VAVLNLASASLCVRACVRVFQSDSICVEAGVRPNGVCRRSVKAAAVARGRPGLPRGERSGLG